MYREPRTLSCTQRVIAWLGALQQWLPKLAEVDPVIRDLHAVSDAARVLDVSDFEVFSLAYRSWYGEAPRTAALERDFGRYLNQQIEMPFYVRRFLPRIATLAA